MKIPFSPPDITEAEIEQVAEALRSGWKSEARSHGTENQGTGKRSGRSVWYQPCSLPEFTDSMCGNDITSSGNW